MNDRIIPARVKRMATPQSGQGKKQTANGPVNSDGVKGVLGACGDKAATRGLEGRNEVLVKLYQFQQ